MVREERVSSNAAPTGAWVAPSTTTDSSSKNKILQWLLSLEPPARERALVLSPLHAMLIQHLAALSAGAPPGQLALFEWPWIEHQLTTLHRKKACPAVCDAAVNDDADSALDDDDPLHRAVNAGKLLLLEVHMISLDRGTATWDGAYAACAEPVRFLRLASTISAGRFLGDAAPRDANGGGGGALRPRCVSWLRDLEVVHVGALCLGLLEASICMSHAIHQQPPSKAPSAPAVSRAVEALREVHTRAVSMRAFVRASANDAARDGALSALRSSTSVAAVDALLASNVAGDWIGALSFPPLMWCVRHRASVADVCAARRPIEARAAEAAAERLLVGDVEQCEAPKSACEGSAGAGAASAEAKRRKKERQQQRKRELKESAPAAVLSVATLQSLPPGEITTAEIATVDPIQLVSDVLAEVIERCMVQATAEATARRKERQTRSRLRQQSSAAASEAIEVIVSAALRDVTRREKKRGKAQERRARKQTEEAAAAAPPTPPMTTPSTRVRPIQSISSPRLSSTSPQSSDDTGVGGDGMAQWMSAAVGKLLHEMDQTHQEQTEGERASRRQRAIDAAESERHRRLLEMRDSMREEEARRAVMRAAAQLAAEGERRRRMKILELEHAEEQRMRARHQQLAIEAMERERERRVSLQTASDSAHEVERLTRQRMARKAIETERVRRVAILRTIEDERCTARQHQRVSAVMAMELERQRRMYEMAKGDWEMAAGVAKPSGLPSTPWPSKPTVSPAGGHSAAGIEGNAPPAAGGDGGPAGGAGSEHGEHAGELSMRPRSSSGRLRWAAFASGVATQLGEEEQAERSKRRQWAAAAVQSEQDRSSLLATLGGEVERWAADEHRRLQPLQARVWRALRALATDTQLLWPSSRVELFGSWASGLQLGSSDVDLLVCGAPGSSEHQLRLELRQLARHLEECATWLEDIQIIDTARVPVIKATALLPPSVGAVCGHRRLQLDISLEGTGHSGVASTSLIRDVFCAHLPGLQPLVLVLKELLSSRHLNSAATGGLSSYALVLMAASLLQQHVGLTSNTPLPGVGHLLVRFLEYFSALPDTHDALHAVVVDSAARLQPKITRRAALASGAGHDDHDARYEEAVYASSLLVQDPLSHRFSNISATAFRWGHVQRCFREALARLLDALQATGAVPVLPEPAGRSSPAVGAASAHSTSRATSEGVLLQALLQAPE